MLSLREGLCEAETGCCGLLEVISRSGINKTSFVHLIQKSLHNHKAAVSKPLSVTLCHFSAQEKRDKPPDGPKPSHL